jgi:hypothetical protein
MLVYTETDLGVFADVSAAAKSASGSTFTFTGTAVDHAIYIASSLSNASDVLEHFGIKTKISTALIPGSGSVVAEYWDGADWVELPCMEVESITPYLPNSINYFQNTGSHHIRYDTELVSDSWTKNDPMTLGTSYFWVRFRIDSAITTAPVFEQFKLHTNRTETNEDGWVEYFGKARPLGQLGINFSAARPFEGNMQNQTIYVNEDIGVGYTQNKFTATTDKTGVAGFLPFDLDTSSPLILQWAGHATASQTIVFTIRWFYVTDNGSDLYYTSEPAPIAGSKSITVSQAITLNEVSMFEAKLDIKEMVSRRASGFGDEIWVSIQASTLSGQFSFTSSQIIYTKWCEGGHV